jgi:hypothetical protein
MSAEASQAADRSAKHVTAHGANVADNTSKDPDPGEVPQAAEVPKSVISDPEVAQVLSELAKLDQLSPAEAADVLEQGVQKLEMILSKSSGR